MQLKLKLKTGVIHEIQVENILEIDGVAFDGLVKPDRDNHEDRIRMLERGLINVTSFLDEKYNLVPSPQEEPSNVELSA